MSRQSRIQSSSEQSSSMQTLEFGRPIIFGDADRPIAGRIHESVGAVRGAVVLCAPWGYEENCSYKTFRLLAQELAKAGFDTLRFDYECCGNSSGDYTLPEQLSRWTASCGKAIDYMSARTGTAVGVVGLRLGASLATIASGAHPLAATVLWDPVVSGKRYLRVLRAMSMMGVDASPDPAEPNSLVAIGNYLTSETIDDLQKLNLQALPAAQMADTLVISRPKSGDSRRLSETLKELGVPTSLEEHPGTDALLDCAAEQSVVPGEIVDRIVQWFQDHPSGTAASHAEVPQTTAVLDAPEHQWTEFHISVGPRKLTGVLTAPKAPRTAGAVLLPNNGEARAIGPARAWVEWSRTWAAAGVASLRLDIGGLGDSRPPENKPRNPHYPIEAIDDISEGVAELNSRGLGPVVAVGLCSGSFSSIDAAAAGVDLAGVVGINAQLFFLPDPPGSRLRERRAASPANRWVQTFVEWRVGRVLSRNTPFFVWRVLQFLRLLPSPLCGADAASVNSRVLLIYGPDNEGFVRIRQRAPHDLERWQNSGGLIVVDGLDHSMFAPQMRKKVEPIVRAFVLKVLSEHSAPDKEPMPRDEGCEAHSAEVQHQLGSVKRVG